MACLPPANWKITDDVVAARTDIRHLPVVSIDPPGCKDIDDALHCRQLENGNFEVCHPLFFSPIFFRLEFTLPM
jgi:exosome complex exonuclease DIS3/RRP44